MIGFAGRAEVLSAETLFSIRKAGRRTEGSSSFILRRWLSLARLLFHTKTESIQLPDGEIDTETLSPVSLYNCINSFLPASLLISLLFTSSALAGDALSQFLCSIVHPRVSSHRTACSHPLEGRGGASACRRNRNCPPVSLSPARRFPELRSQAEERAVQALVFGSPVCPEGDLGGLEGLVT